MPSLTTPPAAVPAADQPPYLPSSVPQTYYIEPYGCQMNFADADLVNAILQANNFHPVRDTASADIVLLVTCAIRENAESKIFRRLDALQFLRQNGGKVALLGCMAERLKFRLLEGERKVDVICGPDAYRDLPRLLARSKEGGVGNVMLSVDETYADILPVQIERNRVSACVSIMRGCNNMCTYCVVPFTRGQRYSIQMLMKGKERSRPVESILREVQHLETQGIRQITLLGQNVNSYRDTSQNPSIARNSLSSSDFKPIYKYRTEGLHFVDLLDMVSSAAPKIRFRFTSPHPQFFPLDLLKLISSRPNIGNQIHLPAQSGSDTVLTRMRRGYTKAAYLSLVDRIRKEIPDVTLSSDFIVGFCGETEEEFRETLKLAEEVEYEMAYNFAYSMREKTKAHRTLLDNVPSEIKKERLMRLNEVYERGRIKKIDAMLGRKEVVLVEKKAETGWTGRSDGNIRVHIEGEIPGERSIEKGDLILAETYRRQRGTLLSRPISRTILSS